MYSYFFVLGRSFEMCKAELAALLNSFDYRILPGTGHVVLIESTQELPIKVLVQRAGGIVKAGQVHSRLDQLDQLDSRLVEIANARFTISKFRYGVSVYGDLKTEKFAHELTLQLNRSFDQRGLKASYVLSDGQEMTSVQVERYHLIDDKGVDFCLIYDNSSVFIGITGAVQPFEEWSQVDFGRPQRDPKSGMLPPKVARMMVHIGLGAFIHAHRGWNREVVIYDPFCGSGTVLTEAMRIGCCVGGSDISEKAVTDSQTNVAWLLNSGHYMVEDGSVDPFFGYKHKKLLPADILVQKEEVAHIDKLIKVGSLDIVVTEPYLGPPFGDEPTPGKLDRIIKGLKKLYIGALSTIKQLLVEDGVIVFAEPVYYGVDKTMKVGIIDNLARFGYTLGSKIVEYKRERSFVGRRIGVLIKK